MKNKVVLLIGGNMGDRHALLEQATVLIQERIGTVVALSGIYETEPWGQFEVEGGRLEVASFLNQGLLVDTTLGAHAVLRETQSIEAFLGRVRPVTTTCSLQTTKKYHSRTMDIDLIFFNDEVIDTPELTIPHPRMHLRRFVLEPLNEIIPDYRHPLLGLTVGELFSAQILKEANRR